MHSTERSEKATSGVDKIARYKWTVRDERGVMEWIEKNKLSVDPIYQRTVSEKKRSLIASNFSWVAFGALSVALRPDGRMFVVDGSHRLAAALSRSDIIEVPCVIFESRGDLLDEANGFLAINTARKPLEFLDKFNAMLVAKDPSAMKADELIRSAGYRCARGSAGDNGRVIRCLSELINGLKTNEDATCRVWPLAVELANGKAIHNRILGSLIWLESRMEAGSGVTASEHWRKLVKVGQDAILRSIADASALYGSGGTTVWAKAVLEVLNKGKRNRLFVKTGHGADDTSA
jgi:hypothetical protein